MFHFIGEKLKVIFQIYFQRTKKKNKLFNLFKSCQGLFKFFSIKNNKKKIVFYSESKHYRNYFLELILKLKTKQNFEIIYVTSDINDLNLIDNTIKPIFIGAVFFRTIFFTILNCDIMIMTLTDLGNHHLKKSKNCNNYIYIFHSAVSTHLTYEKESFKNYDIIFANGEYQRQELIKAEEIYKFPKKKIFNIGYLYHENISKRKNLNNELKKNILFAPSWNKSSKNLFNDYSLFIIESLIENDYFVTLRPHPELIKKSVKILKKIKNKFKNNKKFKLNDNLLDLNPFELSQFIITDNGGVGLEYSLIYRKPAMYINYAEKVHNLSHKELNIEPIENHFKKNFAYEIDVNEIKNIPKIISKMDERFKLKIKNLDNFYEKYISTDKNPSIKATQIISEILSQQ